MCRRLKEFSIDFVFPCAEQESEPQWKKCRGKQPHVSVGYQNIEGNTIDWFTTVNTLQFKSTFSPYLILVQLFDFGTFKKQPVGGGVIEEQVLPPTFYCLQHDLRQLKSLIPESSGM